MKSVADIAHFTSIPNFCLCWGFTAQSTQQCHVERSQFTLSHVYWAGLVLKAGNQYCADSFTRNWQLPFLNQQERENDHRKYVIISTKECCRPGGRWGGGGVTWSTNIQCDKNSMMNNTSFGDVRRFSDWKVDILIFWCKNQSSRYGIFFPTKNICKTLTLVLLNKLRCHTHF